MPGAEVCDGLGKCVTSSELLSNLLHRARSNEDPLALGSGLLHGAASATALATSSWLYLFAPYLQTAALLLLDAARVRPMLAASLVTTSVAYLSIPAHTRSLARGRIARLLRSAKDTIPHLLFLGQLLAIRSAFPPLAVHLPRSSAALALLELVIPGVLTARAALQTRQLMAADLAQNHLAMNRLKRWCEFWVSSSLLMPFVRLVHALGVASSDRFGNGVVAPLRLSLDLWLLLPSPGGASFLVDRLLRHIVNAPQLFVFVKLKESLDWLVDLLVGAARSYGRPNSTRTALQVFLLLPSLSAPRYVKELMLALLAETTQAVSTLRKAIDYVDDRGKYNQIRASRLRNSCMYWSINAALALLHNFLHGTRALPLFLHLRFAACLISGGQSHTFDTVTQRIQGG